MDRPQLRVLYIVTAFPRNEQDLITPWLIEMITQLRRVGVEIEVLAPAYRGGADQVVHGVRVHRFRYAPAGWETLTHDQPAPDRVREHPQYLALIPGYIAAMCTAAARLTRERRYDAVHAHWPMPHALAAFAARTASGTPVVSSYYGAELNWTKKQLRPLLPLARAMVRNADVVTAISTDTANSVRQLHDRPIEIIPYGITIDPAPRPWSVPLEGPGPYTILFAGRLVERKGVHHLIEAVRRMRHREQAIVRIVGDGSKRAALQALAVERGVQDRVRFDGFVSREELSRAFAQCDMFVLPAARDAKGDVEGLGVVLLEALTYGKPVVGSNTGGITDIVLHDRTGLLVPPGDPQALADALDQLIDNPAHARQLGEAGRKHVDAQFSWPVIAQQWREVYDRLAEIRNRA